MFHLIEKKGWIINPNTKVVDAITSIMRRNGGICPCASNKSEDKHCPCSDFRDKNICCCQLYIKEGEE